MKIAIVGGGPAGLIAALYLRGMPGAEIDVYEKQAESAYASTLCAEGLSRDKFRKLEIDTGFSSRPFLAREVQGLKLTFPNRKSGILCQAGATLDRTAWQQGMIAYLRRRGVKFHFASPLSAPDFPDGDWLIGADGPTSRIRKAIGGTVALKPAVQYRMKMDYDREFLEFFFDDMFYTGKLGYGYGWVFPRRSIFNVGVAGTFQMLDAFLEKYGIRGEIIEKRGAPIPINGTCFEQGRIFLIGDAAGLTNPLSGGGLSAIICCAEYLRQALEDGRPGKYTELIRANNFYPPDWQGRRDIFYLPNPVLRQAGMVCNNQRLTPFSPRFIARLGVHPALWRPLFRMARHIRAFKRVSW